jgi:hypothetical protein
MRAKHEFVVARTVRKRETASRDSSPKRGSGVGGQEISSPASKELLELAAALPESAVARLVRRFTRAINAGCRDGCGGNP